MEQQASPVAVDLFKKLNQLKNSERVPFDVIRQKSISDEKDQELLYIIEQEFNIRQMYLKHDHIMERWNFLSRETQTAYKTAYSVYEDEYLAKIFALPPIRKPIRRRDREIFAEPTDGWTNKGKKKIFALGHRFLGFWEGLTNLFKLIISFLPKRPKPYIKIALLCSLIFGGLCVIFAVVKKLIRQMKKEKIVDESTKVSYLAAGMIIISNTFRCVKGFSNAEKIVPYAKTLVKQAANPMILIKLMISGATCLGALWKVDIHSLKLKTKMFWATLRTQDTSGVVINDDLLDMIKASERDFFLEPKEYIAETYPQHYNVDTDTLNLNDIETDDTLILDKTLEILLVLDDEDQIVIDVSVLKGPVYGTTTSDYILHFWDKLGADLRFLIISAAFIFLFYVVVFFLFEDDDVKPKRVNRFKPKTIKESFIPNNIKNMEDYEWWKEYKGSWAEEFDKRDQKEEDERLHEEWLSKVMETSGLVVYYTEGYIKYKPDVIAILNQENLPKENLIVGNVKSFAPRHIIVTTQNFVVATISNNKKKQLETKFKQRSPQELKTPEEKTEKVETEEVIPKVKTIVAKSKSKEIVETITKENKILKKEKGKEKVQETIILGSQGPKYPLPTRLLNNCFYVAKGKHKVGGATPIGTTIVSANHIFTAHYPQAKVNDTIPSVFINKHTGKKCPGKIIKRDSELDLIAFDKPTHYDDGTPAAIKSHKLSTAILKGKEFSIQYHAGEDKITTGTVLRSKGDLGVHNASTERGASGEALIAHSMGNKILGIHLSGDKSENENGFIPAVAIQSFLVRGAQTSSLSSEKEN